MDGLCLLTLVLRKQCLRLIISCAPSRCMADGWALEQMQAV